jgi:hypothetical protein
MFTYGSSAVGVMVSVILFVLGALALVLQGYALIDAIRRPSTAFPAAGKQTKVLWLILLSVATAIGFVSLAAGDQGALNFFNLIAVVAAAVYVTDVRPAVKRITGGGGSSDGFW